MNTTAIKNISNEERTLRLKKRNIGKAYDELLVQLHDLQTQDETDDNIYTIRQQAKELSKQYKNCIDTLTILKSIKIVL